MNVKELIEALSKCNPDAVVVHEEEYGHIEVSEADKHSMAKRNERFYFNSYGIKGIEEQPVVVLS